MKFWGEEEEEEGEGEEDVENPWSDKKRRIFQRPTDEDDFPYFRLFSFFFLRALKSPLTNSRDGGENTKISAFLSTYVRRT